MKNTKIICTIGPSSDNYNTLKSMYEAGMNVARINMSHGTHESHQHKIDLIKKLRDDLNAALGIMLDTKGPEVRIRSFKDGSINIVEGAKFVFTTRDIVGDDNIVSVTYKNLHNEVFVGNEIMVNDGLLSFEIVEVVDKDIITRCIIGGQLLDSKGMSFPGVRLNLPFLSESDKNDLLLAVNNDVDFIAASFVNSESDILEMRKFIESKGLMDCKIIAKIESKFGVDNMEEIISCADGVMVARGDLGVELDYFKLPKTQKDIIKLANSKGKEVIVATEMLESMINKPRPTRAEISDVANAVYDEAGAVMLSGETAMGKYPVKVVKTMATICKYVESTINSTRRFGLREPYEKSVTDIISYSSCSTAIKLNAKAIVVATESGKSARMVSKFRAGVPIIAVVANKKTTHQLALTWGINAITDPTISTVDQLIAIGQKEIKNILDAKNGDLFVMVAGIPMNKKGSTNLVQVERIV